ncbi:hypothetical protein RRG08_000315 [Elysia crispata]|uniref:Uncharacterized protein n=1 Tax=Elysia crispata TaxID=231223 RepID=A0AAE1BBZ5_9GAST|nr:hypothetical protein RRG08_000315 [Elysia crispata]
MALLSTKPKKAPGPHGITNYMLPYVGPAAKNTRAIFNQSWHLGHVPYRWREAVIRPILKKGKDKKKTGSYRPTSLLICLGKLLERTVNSRLMWFLESKKLLSLTQTCYRQHHSTEDSQQIQDSGNPILPLKSERNSLHSAGWRENVRQANLLGSHPRSKTFMEASSGDSGEQKHQKSPSRRNWLEQFENSTSSVHRQCSTCGRICFFIMVYSIEGKQDQQDKVQNMGLRIIHGAIHLSSKWRKWRIFSLLKKEETLGYNAKQERQKDYPLIPFIRN